MFTFLHCGCIVGYYCPENSSIATPCPPGSHNPYEGMVPTVIVCYVSQITLIISADKRPVSDAVENHFKVAEYVLEPFDLVQV